MTTSLDDSLVVVTGLPRSGTSLVMSMLHAGGVPVLTDEVRKPDADNPRGYFEYAAVKRLATEPDVLSAARGCAVKIVIPLIRFLHAPARLKVIWISRSMDEILASQTAMLSRKGQQNIAPSQLLEQAMRKQIQETEEWLASKPDIAVLRLEHGAVISDGPAAAVAIQSFLGLPLESAAMAACVDPALHRQRTSPAN